MAILILKYFKHIKQKIQTVLPKPDGPLARIMLSSVIATASSAICEIFINDTIDEDSLLVIR